MHQTKETPSNIGDGHILRGGGGDTEASGWLCFSHQARRGCIILRSGVGKSALLLLKKHNTTKSCKCKEVFLEFPIRIRIFALSFQSHIYIHMLNLAGNGREDSSRTFTHSTWFPGAGRGHPHSGDDTEACSSASIPAKYPFFLLSACGFKSQAFTV